MANLDRESMAEDVRERLDALTDYEQQVLGALMEAPDYSLEEALDDVEREDVRERLDALTDYEQQVLVALLEASDYSIDQALDIVESGGHEFYPGITSLADLAYKFVHGGEWGDSGILAKIGPYITINYDKLGADLYADGYRETSSGIVRLW